jgi:hypothetical protein
LELLGPAWHAALRADLSNKTPLKFLAAGYADPLGLAATLVQTLARWSRRE